MPDRRYKVLFVCGHPVQYMSPLLRRMAQHPQLEISTVYCRLRGATAGVDPEFGAKIQWDIPLLDGYPWVEIPNKGTDSEGFWGLYNPGLWRFVREGNFDAVFCLTGYIRASFWITYLACKLSRSAFIFGTDASSLAPRDGRAWKTSVKKLLWPLLFRLADQVLVPSSAGASMMRELAIPTHRISLIPFVVDNDRWIEQSDRADRKATRAEWGVSDRELVVLFCAKLQDWKRPLDLLHAFAKAAVPGAVLIFAGEGPLRSQIESEAAALGIAPSVRILGFTNQSRLPAVYSAADLFVLPSEYDPCPVVVCEAMLCACPVVISDQIRGRFDLVRPGLTGDIFPCGDVDALAAVLRRLLLDRAGLGALAANARQRMESWSPREYFAGVLEAVERAVSRTRPTS
jgi:glycosyltransferase involved in cell wall biosynthesis